MSPANIRFTRARQRFRWYTPPPLPQTNTTDTKRFLPPSIPCTNMHGHNYVCHISNILCLRSLTLSNSRISGTVLIIPAPFTEVFHSAYDSLCSNRSPLYLFCCSVPLFLMLYFSYLLYFSTTALPSPLYSNPHVSTSALPRFSLLFPPSTSASIGLSLLSFLHSNWLCLSQLSLNHLALLWSVFCSSWLSHFA